MVHWHTQCEQICDTLSWFPTKVTMPLASSTDLVIAGINDIIHALSHPSNNPPFAPRMDSEVQIQTLRDITTLLSNIAAPPPTAPSHLRVEPEQNTVFPLKNRPVHHL
jgi:hypothetical protein